MTDAEFQTAQKKMSFEDRLKLIEKAKASLIKSQGEFNKLQLIQRAKELYQHQLIKEAIGYKANTN